MPRFLKRTLLILGALFLFAVLSVSITAIKLLMDKDDAPLDYSELAVEMPTTDPDVNGYSLMRSFSENYAGELDYDLIEKLRAEPRDQWNPTEIETVLEQHVSLIEGLEPTFSRPIFKFDQEAKPETLIPEVQVLKNYVQLKILKARLLQIKENDSAALHELLKLQNQLRVYVESEGPLICLLVSAAQIAVLEKELFRFVSDAELSDLEWIQAARPYDVYEAYSGAIRSTYEQEFQFASYCLNQVAFDPAQAMQDIATLSETDEKPSWIAHRIYKGFAALCYRPTETRNSIYKSYLEIASQAELPVQARKFEYNNELNSQFQKRSRSDMIDSNIIGKILLGIILPTHEVILDRITLYQSSGAAIQLSFALRAYHQANGTLPDTLDALIPEYLEVIPRDPYDGAPLRYSKEQAILYSVGNDFTDSGGSSLPFAHQLSEDEYRDCAELDKSEPTFSLRFAK